MDDILRALYDGRIYPAEQYIPHGSDYKNLFDNYYSKRICLEAKLDPAIVQDLEDMMQSYLDVVSEDLFAMFSEGYRLGVGMILAALEDS